MATCKDCIHYDVCIRIRYPSMYGLTGEDCERFAQKSRFDPARMVLIPCRIGQDMWCVRDYKGAKHPMKGEVSEMYFTAQMKLMIVVKCVGRGEYGKTVFPTKEEAEAEMQKRMPEPTTVPDNSEHCVCCGDVIPEGRQVCPKCEKGN